MSDYSEDCKKAIRYANSELVARSQKPVVFEPFYLTEEELTPDFEPALKKFHAALVLAFEALNKRRRAK